MFVGRSVYARLLNDGEGLEDLDDFVEVLPLRDLEGRLALLVLRVAVHAGLQEDPRQLAPAHGRGDVEGRVAVLMKKK